mmetsp:Transcript_41281/g.127531  ORF Transcript_41281/g.127531 Transcript_41281/m.127531 type:complete len:422 (-) Transcript_41281:288-1553(-)|eukprot:CAMPEP_0174850384 /NCGR_PEP_ID=MMETSP1114-20130205/19200_1 /TAXON_ID=312471 /ORGANISM="Neobodo designis, Strain CCAP 1951/1" /LENGTH=421 /DNA_ID=CAMNT_0016084843 /DNA_START=116 /DNA_END=1381 /DNA_ORIENTATION=+
MCVCVFFPSLRWVGLRRRLRVDGRLKPLHHARNGAVPDELMCEACPDRGHVAPPEMRLRRRRIPLPVEQMKPERLQAQPLHHRLGGERPRPVQLVRDDADGAPAGLRLDPLVKLAGEVVDVGRTRGVDDADEGARGVKERLQERADAPVADDLGDHDLPVRRAGHGLPHCAAHAFGAQGFAEAADEGLLARHERTRDDDALRRVPATKRRGDQLQRRRRPPAGAGDEAALALPQRVGARGRDGGVELQLPPPRHSEVADPVDTGTEAPGLQRRGVASADGARGERGDDFQNRQPHVARAHDAAPDGVGQGQAERVGARAEELHDEVRRVDDEPSREAQVWLRGVALVRARVEREDRGDAARLVIGVVARGRVRQAARCVALRAAAAVVLVVVRMAAGLECRRRRRRLSAAPQVGARQPRHW